MLVAFGLSSLIGLAGVVVAAIISASLLGVAIPALFGAETRRLFLIGGLFMLIPHPSLAGIAFDYSSLNRRRYG